ncbi:hypothetical protein V6259_09880 [Marinomonas sp. TI.3.20]|uniref:hypothetical protein n=1 Tax=Marinomonas sp. TI.3.20 TaxID=3121296 RepID=UPI00311FFCB4
MHARQTQKGWISLPIIFFLLVVAGLSVAYQQKLQESFQWRATLAESNQSRERWYMFEQDIVTSPVFNAAQKSLCDGFCPLTPSSHLVNTNVWRHGEESITYLWRYYINSLGVRFYRLCASQNHQQYHCWWWQEKIPISRGFVGVAS